MKAKSTKPSRALVERCARALYDFDYHDTGREWGRESPRWHKAYRNVVRAVLVEAAKEKAR